MTNQGYGPAKRIPLEADHRSVLLIAPDADEAARLLGELGAVTEEPLRVEWATELAAETHRLQEGGIGAGFEAPR